MRYRGTIDIYGKNHKLKRTNDFWKITFKADEDPLDTITVLSCYSKCGLWKGGSIHIFAWALIRNVDSQAHPDLLSQKSAFLTRSLSDCTGLENKSSHCTLGRSRNHRCLSPTPRESEFIGAWALGLATVPQAMLMGSRV